MKIKITLGLLMLAGSAAAQPTDPPPPTPVPAPDPDPPPPPTPAPAPPPTFVETQPPPMSEPIDVSRPEGFTIGLGFGYQLPNSLETPNVTSGRFRLASGLTFEAVARLQQSSREVDVGTSSKDKETTLEIGLLGRYPLKGRGRFDLVLLGGLAIENVNTQPDADDSDTSTTRFAGVYGLAVECWITEHWNFSVNALNTVINMNRVSEQMGPGTETVVTNLTIGAIWDPAISAMLHVFY